MLHARRLPILGLLLLAAAGCASQTPPAQQQAQSAPPAPPRPPTPASVKPENPGGDADDPERAALERLLAEPWGFRRDHWNTLHVPLADWKNWRRVRLWGYPTRAAFRFGDEHHAVISIWYSPIEGPNDPDACLASFQDKAMPVADTYGVRIGERQRVRMNQTVGTELRPMALELLDGRVDGIIAHDDYVGAVAAYQSFPGTCLIQGFAVVATRHNDLARKIRDRWVAEGAAHLVWEANVKEAPAPETR
jgi:hypothetical protein